MMKPTEKHIVPPLLNIGKRPIRPQPKSLGFSDSPPEISPLLSTRTSRKKTNSCHKERSKPSFFRFKDSVLDLDETLLHASTEPFSNATLTLNIKIEGKHYLYHVAIRPGLSKLLSEVSKHYNVCVYTSSVKEYAMALVEATGIKKHLFQLYTREFCTKTSDEIFIKDIFSLGFPTSSTILIDDFVMQMRNQSSNTLIVKRFVNDMADRELLKLIPFLEYLASLESVAPVLQKLIEFSEKKFQVKEEKKSVFPLLTPRHQKSESFTLNKNLPTYVGQFNIGDTSKDSKAFMLPKITPRNNSPMILNRAG